MHLKLREIPPLDKPQYNKIPPTWNGADQQGLTKTIIFIIALLLFFKVYLDTYFRKVFKHIRLPKIQEI